MLLALAFRAALPAKEFPAVVPSQRTITVLSEAEAKAKPDLGVMAVHFTGYGWSVQKARDKADKLIREFLGKLEKEKVAPRKTELGQTMLKPSYQFNRDLKTNVPADFIATRRVELELADAADIEKILDLSLSLGSFWLESARMTVQDRAALEQAAFQAALEAGRKKAEAAAKALNAELGGVAGVEELSFTLEEVNLIQEGDFAGGSSLREAERKKSDGTAEEGAVERAEKPAPEGDLVRARSKLRITFFLK